MAGPAHKSAGASSNRGNRAKPRVAPRRHRYAAMIKRPRRDGRGPPLWDGEIHVPWYNLSNTVGRTYFDAQFVGFSFMPAHVEMGLIGMDANPMV